MESAFSVSPFFLPVAMMLFFYWKKNGDLPFSLGFIGAPLFAMYQPSVAAPPTPTPPVTPPSPPPTPTPPCPTCPTCPTHHPGGRVEKAIVEKIGSIPVNIGYTQTTNGVETSGQLPTVTIGQLPTVAKDVKQYQAFMAENDIDVTFSNPSIQFANPDARDEWAKLRSRPTGPIGYNRH